MNMKEVFQKKRLKMIVSVIMIVVFFAALGIIVHRISSELESQTLMAQLSDEKYSEKMLESLKQELNEAMDKLIELSEDNTEMNQKYEENLDSLYEKIDVMNDEITKLNDMVTELLKNTTEINENILNVDNDIKQHIKQDMNNEPTNPSSQLTLTPTPTPTLTPILTPTPTPTTVPTPTPLPTTIPLSIVKKGDNFTVTIYAESIADLYGYQFQLYYDKNKATYQGDLRSLVSDIDTIFYKDKPDYMLIGATMLGAKSGANGNKVSICSLTFTANEDYDISTLRIDGVNTVTSSQSYIENVSGWSFQIKDTP